MADGSIRRIPQEENGRVRYTVPPVIVPPADGPSSSGLDGLREGEQPGVDAITSAGAWCPADVLRYPTAPGADSLGQGIHVFPLPDPEGKNSWLWVEVAPGGAREVESFAFFSEDHEAALATSGDPDVARRLVDASRQFNVVLARGVESGQSPRAVYEAWQRVNLGEAMVDGTVLAGDGNIGPAQALLLMAGGLGVAKSWPELPGATRRPRAAPSLEDPKALFFTPAEAIADAFNDAGYLAHVRPSNRGSRAALIIEIDAHPTITQVQTHPGGGRHGGRYLKISTSDRGIIKVVDPKTYKPTPGEKATIIEYTED